MKKLLIMVMAVGAAAITANAQDVYKQTGGEKNLEFQFAPLGGSPIGIGGIKFRSFTDANTALRAEVFLGMNSSTTITEVTPAPNENELRDRNMNIDASIAVGIEKHWTGTDRLSPYYGATVSLGISRQTSKSEFEFDNTVEESTTKQGSIFAGVNLISGMDFYFADNIYLGAELGFGLLFTNLSKVVSESTLSSDTFETPRGGSFNIGPNVVPRIRLGFLF